ncbi:uncharacterized protein YbjT (DUF2867 family) [Lipingzhangella halophila]|uniref:Uncharacterized protein YbjT (DUF2867 family) n=1 Tax=Lipingzhangella halophila TaxID=1783352 RepID=A0A7W7REK6_9ACTN|nr:NAD(P)H-binding protein [Lipingzhangella halophila]MBB4930474.1 uncharacterized protein YbjT (DUF2867 family) [Lipingzhangella halophila]
MTQQTTRPILVLGATGKTGRRVVSRLRANGTPVRAASRSSDTRFDWHDRTTWAAALDGVSALYLVLPPQEAPAGDLVTRAVAAGVNRIVLLSGRGAQHIEYASSVEQAVRDSGAQWAIMRPNNFNQNFTEDVFYPMVRSGELALPIGQVPEPFIDAEDIADVAVALLTEDGYHGHTYEMTGPRALTWAEAAETIGAATGRPVRFVDVPAEEFVPAALAAGVAPDAAEELSGNFAVMREGVIAEVDDGVQRVLGREPRDFTAYVKQAAASGAWD